MNYRLRKLLGFTPIFLALAGCGILPDLPNLFPSPATDEGTVVDCKGVPVSGMVYALGYKRHPYSNAPGVGSTHTDGHGKFQISTSDTAHYFVQVSPGEITVNNNPSFSNSTCPK